MPHMRRIRLIGSCEATCSIEMVAFGGVCSKTHFLEMRIGAFDENGDEPFADAQPTMAWKNVEVPEPCHVSKLRIGITV